MLKAQDISLTECTASSYIFWPYLTVIFEHLLKLNRLGNERTSKQIIQSYSDRNLMQQIIEKKVDEESQTRKSWGKHPNANCHAGT